MAAAYHVHFNYDIKSRARFEAQHANAREKAKRFHGERDKQRSEGDCLSNFGVTRIALQIKSERIWWAESTNSTVIYTYTNMFISSKNKAKKNETAIKALIIKSIMISECYRLQCKHYNAELIFNQLIPRIDYVKVNTF